MLERITKCVSPYVCSSCAAEFCAVLFEELPSPGWRLVDIRTSCTLLGLVRGFAFILIDIYLAFDYSFMAHPEMLLPIPEIEDPVERFVSVVKFYLSGWHIKPPYVLFLPPYYLLNYYCCLIFSPCDASLTISCFLL